MTILDIAQSMKGNLRDGLSQTQAGTQPKEASVSYGTAIGDSSGGFVTILMDGAPVSEPGYVQSDYTFTVSCDSPIADGDRIAYISNSGYGKAVSVANLSTIAQNADAIASATNQHFWADTNGVHVSTDDGDPAGDQNIIVNANGVLLRESSANLAAFTPSAVAFYDGEGNNAENIVASFGKDGATIGSPSSSQVYIDDNGMDVINEQGMVIAEMRQSSNAITEKVTKVVEYSPNKPYARSVTLTGLQSSSTFTAVYTISGGSTTNTATFTVGTSASGVKLKADPLGIGDIDIVTLDYDGSTAVTITVNYSPKAGRLTITYPTSSYYPPYFTFGTRGSSAKARFSTTIGRQLNAIYVNATAIGKYNADGNYALMIGNGTADDARSNALTVAWDGTTAFGTDVATTTIADIITQTSTQSTNYPVTSATFTTWGRLAQLTVTITPPASVSTNTNMSIGTIASGKRPVRQAVAGSAYIMGAVTAVGEVSARPRTALSANSSYNIAATYILE